MYTCINYIYIYVYIHVKINSRTSWVCNIHILKHKYIKQLPKREYYQPVSVTSVCNEYVAMVAPGVQYGRE